MKSRYIFSLSNPLSDKLEKPQSILYQNNFAAKMIELEILIELDDFDLETVQRLMDFYSQAVDYFVQNQSNDYLYFKNKIKALLLKPKVVEFINSQDSKLKKEDKEKAGTGQKIEGDNSKGLGKKPHGMQTRPSYEFHSKMEHFHLNKELSTAHQKQHVEHLVQSYARKHEAKEGVIKTSLMDQKNSLRRRLEQRKTNSRQFANAKSMLSADKSTDEKHKRVVDLSVNMRPQSSFDNHLILPKHGYEPKFMSNDDNIYSHLAENQEQEQKGSMQMADEEEENLYQKHTN